MVFKIKFLKLAEIEIDESIDLYERRSKGLGKYFFTYLKSYITILKTNPDLFEIKKVPFYRELPLKKYPFVIIYEILGDEVLISFCFSYIKKSIKEALNCNIKILSILILVSILTLSCNYKKNATETPTQNFNRVWMLVEFKDYKKNYFVKKKAFLDIQIQKRQLL